MIAPVTPQLVLSLIQQMLASPADQVRLASQLRSMVQAMPPPHAELVSRYRFDRAGLWTYSANFFNVAPNVEAPLEVIRIPHDCWIRSVHAYALTRLDQTFEVANGMLHAARFRDTVNEATGSNFRGLFETNWKLNARQGFISSGVSERLAPATLVCGDGQNAAELDWRLQQEDTIEVRVRNIFRNLFRDSTGSPPAKGIYPTIPWVCVSFWAEELPQPQ
jgi:hypothetical protein